MSIISISDKILNNGNTLRLSILKFAIDVDYDEFVLHKFLKCRAHPSNIKKIAQETLGAQDTIIASNFNNNVIEWVIKDQNKDIMEFNHPDASIICTRLMIPNINNQPGLLPESEWWFKSHLFDNKRCFCLGIDLDDLEKPKDNKHM
ncbi:unnamed protein product [Rotaria sp. Silwood2]|nr:unnamed protein product [Rotaria sp. Silwood2]CAF3895852.1 unnamed protein product [Rotaria sp. Silwood2]